MSLLTRTLSLVRVAVPLALVLAALAATGAAASTLTGCTFKKGRTTCIQVTVTTITQTVTEEVTGTSADGSLPGAFCLEQNPSHAYYLVLPNPGDEVRFSGRMETTTTTVRHGSPKGNGKVISQTTASSLSNVVFGPGGTVGCGPFPF